MEKYYVQATCKDWKSRESQNSSRYSTLLYLGELPNEDMIRTFIHQAVGDGFGNLCHKFTYPEYRTFIAVDVEQEGKTYRWADMLNPRSENSYTESRSITDIDFEVFTVSSGKADSLLDVEEISAKLLDEARVLQTTPMICHSTGLAFDYICVATFVHHVIGKVKDYADRWTERNSRNADNATAQEAPAKRKKGAKGMPLEKRVEDASIVADWKDAKSNGITKKEFAQERNMTTRAIDAVIDRVRKRETRSNPQ